MDILLFLMIYAIVGLGSGLLMTRLEYANSIKTNEDPIPEKASVIGSKWTDEERHQKEIERRNFRKKILSFGIVEETENYSPIKTGRPAKLFRFNKKKYNDLAKDGFHFEIKFA